MKILVTGTEGYIGVCLAQVLHDKGHHVIGLDSGYYRDGWLYQGVNWKPETRIQDLRELTSRDLEGFDAVAHLAELSNDPLGQHNPEVTYAINHVGSVNLAKAAKEAGVKRFVYTSSCSVYGMGTDDFVTEESATNPLTAYAKCKVLVERDVSAIADQNFTPTFLRNATAYGASPRMRFDIVLNDLCAMAWTAKEIRMISDGTPWRPLVHLRDICGAIAAVLDAERNVVHNQIFNVGSTEENYRVKEIAKIVAETFPNCELSFGKPSGDDRSYRVSFDKIKKALPNFKCEYTAKKGAAELLEVFQRIQMPVETYQFRAFTRLKQLEHLIRTKQIDSQFRWY